MSRLSSGRRLGKHIVLARAMPLLRLRRGSARRPGPSRSGAGAPCWRSDLARLLRRRVDQSSRGRNPRPGRKRRLVAFLRALRPPAPRWERAMAPKHPQAEGTWRLSSPAPETRRTGKRYPAQIMPADCSSGFAKFQLLPACASILSISSLARPRRPARIRAVTVASNRAIKPDSPLRPDPDRNHASLSYPGDLAENVLVQ